MAAATHRIFVYCDGACLGNNQLDRALRRAGYGLFVRERGAADIEIAEELPDDVSLRTSSRAELRGLLSALDHLRLRDDNATLTATIVCDNDYVVKTANVYRFTWRRTDFCNRAHADLLQPIDALLDRFGARVTVAWTRAHTKTPPTDDAEGAREWFGNAMADALANKAVGDESKLRVLRARSARESKLAAS